MLLLGMRLLRLILLVLLIVLLLLGCVCVMPISRIILLLDQVSQTHCDELENPNPCREMIFTLS